MGIIGWHKDWRGIAKAAGLYDEYVHGWMERWNCPDCDWYCLGIEGEPDHVRCNGLPDVYHHESQP